MTALVDSDSYAGYGYSVISRYSGDMEAKLFFQPCRQFLYRVMRGSRIDLMVIESLCSIWPFRYINFLIPILHIQLGCHSGLLFMYDVARFFAAYFLACLLTERREFRSFRFSLKVIFVISWFSAFSLGFLNFNTHPYPNSELYTIPIGDCKAWGMLWTSGCNYATSWNKLPPEGFADASNSRGRIVQRISRYGGAQRVPCNFGYDRYSSISSVYGEETIWL